MEVRQAVRTATEYVLQAFSGEEISNLGLEEVEYVPDRSEWLITVGFSRPWNYPKKKKNLLDWPRSLFPEETNTQPFDRDYKVVHINEASGEVTAIKNRFGPAEA